MSTSSVLSISMLSIVSDLKNKTKIQDFLKSNAFIHQSLEVITVLVRYCSVFLYRTTRHVIFDKIRIKGSTKDNFQKKYKCKNKYSIHAIMCYLYNHWQEGESPTRYPTRYLKFWFSTSYPILPIIVMISDLICIQVHSITNNYMILGKSFITFDIVSSSVN